MTKATARALSASVLIFIGATPVSAQQLGRAESISLTDTIPRARLLTMIDHGARLFNSSSCIFCHAIGGRGDGQRGPSLTDVEWLHSEGDFESILETIRWGVRVDDIKAVSPRPFPMVPDGGMNINSADRRALTAYVWSLSNGPVTEAIEKQNDLITLLDAGEGKQAADILRADARTGPDFLMFSENAVNALGYEYLQRWESPETAIELFLFNTEAHPESWNTWDSLGEGYAALGEIATAIQHYEKALEMNPQSTTAAAALEDLRSR